MQTIAQQSRTPLKYIILASKQIMQRMWSISVNSFLFAPVTVRLAILRFVDL